MRREKPRENGNKFRLEGPQKTVKTTRAEGLSIPGRALLGGFLLLSDDLSRFGTASPV